jgi:hypothetical protein
MRHADKLANANVVGAFDTQEEADDAVYELRLAGFGNDRVAEVTRETRGAMTDFAAKSYAGVGAVLGAVLGAAFGLYVGWVVAEGRSVHLGPALFGTLEGTLIANVVCWAVLGGITGAFCGWGVPKPVLPAGPDVHPGEFLVEVAAGDRKDEAGAILRRRGGHEPAHEPMGPAPVM